MWSIAVFLFLSPHCLRSHFAALDQNYTGKNVALFLRLFISLNIVAPMEIPTNIRELV
jgi:hypothetical protein